MHGVDWTPVIAAVATGVASLFAAIVALLTRREVKSNNGRTTGATVTATHDAVADLRQAVEDLQVLVAQLTTEWAASERRSRRRR